MDIKTQFRLSGSWDDKELDPALCEIIAERIALEFAEWCEHTKSFENFGYSHAFEIFKKEKSY